MAVPVPADCTLGWSVTMGRLCLRLSGILRVGLLTVYGIVQTTSLNIVLSMVRLLSLPDRGDEHDGGFSSAW